LPNGDIGAHAVQPVFVGDRRIENGNSLLLEDGQVLSLCEDDMTVVSKYKLQIFE